MRKGRGLVDVQIYNEMLKIQGTHELLLNNITNHRENPKTKKLCAEIHEEVWQEVKAMVANYKRQKKGQPQKPFERFSSQKPISQNEKIDPKQKERIRKLKNLKSGNEFAYKNVGYGLVSYERAKDVLGVKKGRLFTETFDSEGMKWNGETWKFDSGLGMASYIVLLEDVPEGELD